MFNFVQSFVQCKGSLADGTTIYHVEVYFEFSCDTCVYFSLILSRSIVSIFPELCGRSVASRETVSTFVLAQHGLTPSTSGNVESATSWRFYTERRGRFWRMSSWVNVNIVCSYFLDPVSFFLISANDSTVFSITFTVASSATDRLQRFQRRCFHLGAKSGWELVSFRPWFQRTRRECRVRGAGVRVWHVGRGPFRRVERREEGRRRRG